MPKLVPKGKGRGQKGVPFSDTDFFQETVRCSIAAPCAMVCDGNPALHSCDTCHAAGAHSPSPAHREAVSSEEDFGEELWNPARLPTSLDVDAYLK